jgi:hydroxyacylglutathione hydrolase
MNSTRPRVELVPIFEDNYVFMIINPMTRETLCVDPGTAAPILEYLKDHDLTLSGILITHHHNDHIGGVQKILEQKSVPVYAPMKNKNHIPFASHYVHEGDRISLASFDFTVLELPGHTLGHVAYWNEANHWLFSGDVLFGLGCGRLFEGTPEQMYQSLERIKKFPDNTLIFCTHEYTESNLLFCKMLTHLDDSPLTGDDENLEIYERELSGKREIQLPSVPLKLSIEKKANPFLLASSVKQFAYLRELRNKN